jgi:predicted ribosomally synthesized peptide with nif11-like leader
MAQADVARLFRAVQADPSLREQLNATATIEQFVQLANSLGYDFSQAEWQSMTGFSVEELAGELSEIPGL